MNFRFKPNVEEGTMATNNGHVVHRLELFLDEPIEPGEIELAGGVSGDGEVGYINVTYVPEEVWEERYSGDEGLLRWLDDFKGKHFKPDRYELSKTVRGLSKECEGWHDWLSKEDVEEMSEEELENLFDVYLSDLWDEYETEWKNTYRYHVDKPRVEFIRVLNDYQRNGYGTKLYRKMAEILNEEYDMKLHSTNLQREAAEKTWDSLLKEDWSKAEEVEMPFENDDGTRYALSVKKAVTC